jgi:hypothetical protein
MVKPDLDICLRTSSASVSLSSIIRTRNVVSIVKNSFCLVIDRLFKRWRLIDDEPIQAKKFYCFGKLMKIDRFTDVAVHPQIVTNGEILVLFG